MNNIALVWINGRDCNKGNISSCTYRDSYTNPSNHDIIRVGDLAVSLIKEMPPGRKPVKTYAVDSSYKERLRTFFGKEMAEGASSLRSMPFC